MDYLEKWLADVDEHLNSVSAEELELGYLKVKEQDYIEYMADKFEVPKEQMMIAIAVIEISQDEGFWNSYHVGSQSAVEYVLGKVFKE